MAWRCGVGGALLGTGSICPALLAHLPINRAGQPWTRGYGLPWLHPVMADASLTSCLVRF